VADVTPGHHIDHILADVGGVVADPFQVFCHQDEIKGREDDFPSCR
jgi:hypothetical protein